MNIAVLGAGMVGRVIAKDLQKNHQVTSFDINEKNLLSLKQIPGITCKQADLSAYDAYATMLSGFDLVVSAVPGFMGYKTLESIIKAGKDVVDISFFPENALDLHDLAISKNVTAIVDCGVAPGMSNLILGYYDTQMTISSFECMVGGLPKKRIKPFEYKAPFSPIDVLEEYTRPARYVEHGEIVTRPALSDAELIDFEKAGTLESFNTDGLRSILHTMKHIPDMKEKTLRYPGHIQLIQSLLKAGFLDSKPIECNGQLIRPVDFTSALLFNQWKLEEGEAEFTIMKIVIRGTKAEKPMQVEYFLYDEYDSATEASSMSRTTGYTCTAAVNMVSEKVFSSKGVFPPELIGKDKRCFEYIMAYLQERHVTYTCSIS